VTARRPLLTAAAAGSVLLALWFVPSANATAEEDGASGPGQRTAAPARSGAAEHARAADATVTGGTGGARAADASGGSVASGTETADGGLTPQHALADTGSPDTTPYVIGGAACLAFGAGLVSYSVRRGAGGTSGPRGGGPGNATA
jgi:hypothetical protein